MMMYRGYVLKDVAIKNCLIKYTKQNWGDKQYRHRFIMNRKLVDMVGLTVYDEDCRCAVYLVKKGVNWLYYKLFASRRYGKILQPYNLNRPNGKVMLSIPGSKKNENRIWPEFIIGKDKPLVAELLDVGIGNFDFRIRRRRRKGK